MKSDVSNLVVTPINAGFGRRALSNEVKPEALAGDVLSLITAAGPDIMVVSEAFRVWPTTGPEYIDFGEQLARQLGKPYHSVFCPNLDSDVHSHPNKWQRPAFAGLKRAMQGNAIVTKLPLGKWPWAPEKTNNGFPGGGTTQAINVTLNSGAIFASGDRNTEPKSAVVVPLEYGDSTIIVAAVHLTTLKGDDRRSSGSPSSVARIGQMKALLEMTRQLRAASGEKPVRMIIAGDFNAVIESDEMQLLLKEFNTSNAPRWEDTSPEALWSHVDHKVLIDHVLWSGFECVDYFVAGRSLEKAGVLDHLPVVARLT